MRMKVKPFSLSIPFNTNPPSDWKDTWDVQLYVKVEDEEDYGWGETLVAGSGIINSYLSIINDIVIPVLSKVELTEPTDVRTILEKILF